MPPFFSGMLTNWKIGAMSVSLLGSSPFFPHCIRPTVPLPSIPLKPFASRQVAKPCSLKSSNKPGPHSAAIPFAVFSPCPEFPGALSQLRFLLSYGSGFRSVLMYTFEVFGKGAVIAWPGTTSEQAGGERAGKPVRFEAEDAEWVKAQSPLIRRVTRETVRFQGVSHDERRQRCSRPWRLSRIWRNAQRNPQRRSLDHS